ncbi:hypothetical protein ACIQVK_53740, partial [Streptomyces sp. NPDC090493]|uniref:hypothetical protein n=1 Tax=Streptomyces sp. NPDC090493 TaxID=3365964 RepID=UPI0037F7449A
MAKTLRRRQSFEDMAHRSRREGQRSALVLGACFSGARSDEVGRQSLAQDLADLLFDLVDDVYAAPREVLFSKEDTSHPYRATVSLPRDAPNFERYRAVPRGPYLKKLAGVAGMSEADTLQLVRRLRNLFNDVTVDEETDTAYPSLLRAASIVNRARESDVPGRYGETGVMTLSHMVAFLNEHDELYFQQLSTSLGVADGEAIRRLRSAARSFEPADSPGLPMPSARGGPEREGVALQGVLSMSGRAAGWPAGPFGASAEASDRAVDEDLARFLFGLGGGRVTEGHLSELAKELARAGNAGRAGSIAAVRAFRFERLRSALLTEETLFHTLAGKETGRNWAGPAKANELSTLILGEGIVHTHTFERPLWANRRAVPVVADFDVASEMVIALDGRGGEHRLSFGELAVLLAGDGELTGRRRAGDALVFTGSFMGRATAGLHEVARALQVDVFANTGKIDFYKAQFWFKWKDGTYLRQWADVPVQRRDLAAGAWLRVEPGVSLGSEARDNWSIIIPDRAGDPIGWTFRPEGDWDQAVIRGYYSLHRSGTYAVESVAQDGGLLVQNMPWPRVRAGERLFFVDAVGERGYVRQVGGRERLSGEEFARQVAARLSGFAEKPVVVLTFGHANELPEGGDPLKHVSVARALATELGRDVFVPPGDASWEQGSREGRLTLRQSGGGEGEGLVRVVPEATGEALALVARGAGVSDEVTAGQVERLLQFLFGATLESRGDYRSLLSAAGALFSLRQAAGLPVEDGSGRLSLKEVSDFASVRGLLDAVDLRIRDAFVTLVGEILGSPLRAKLPGAAGFADVMGGAEELPARMGDSLDVMGEVGEWASASAFPDAMGGVGDGTFRGPGQDEALPSMGGGGEGSLSTPLLDTNEGRARFLFRLDGGRVTEGHLSELRNEVVRARNAGRAGSMDEVRAFRFERLRSVLLTEETLFHTLAEKEMGRNWAGPAKKNELNALVLGEISMPRYQFERPLWADRRVVPVVADFDVASGMVIALDGRAGEHRLSFGELAALLAGDGELTRQRRAGDALVFTGSFMGRATAGLHEVARALQADVFANTGKMVFQNPTDRSSRKGGVYLKGWVEFSSERAEWPAGAWLRVEPGVSVGSEVREDWSIVIPGRAGQPLGWTFRPEGDWDQALIRGYYSLHRSGTYAVESVAQDGGLLVQKMPWPEVRAGERLFFVDAVGEPGYVRQVGGRERLSGEEFARQVAALLSGFAEKPVVVLTFGHAIEPAEGADPLKDVSVARALATELGRDVFALPGDPSWENAGQSHGGRLTLRQSGGGEGEGLVRVVPEATGQALALLARRAGVSDEVSAGQVERLLRFLFGDTFEARWDYWSLVSAAGALFSLRQAAGLPVADGSGRLSLKEVSDFASVRGLLDAVAPHMRDAFVTLVGKILGSPLRAESPGVTGFPDDMGGLGAGTFRGPGQDEVLPSMGGGGGEEGSLSTPLLDTNEGRARFLFRLDGGRVTEGHLSELAKEVARAGDAGRAGSMDEVREFRFERLRSALLTEKTLFHTLAAKETGRNWAGSAKKNLLNALVLGEISIRKYRFEPSLWADRRAVPVAADFDVASGMVIALDGGGGEHRLSFGELAALLAGDGELTRRLRAGDPVVFTGSFMGRATAGLHEVAGALKTDVFANTGRMVFQRLADRSSRKGEVYLREWPELSSKKVEWAAGAWLRVEPGVSVGSEVREDWSIVIPDRAGHPLGWTFRPEGDWDQAVIRGYYSLYGSATYAVESVAQDGELLVKEIHWPRVNADERLFFVDAVGEPGYVRQVGGRERLSGEEFARQVEALLRGVAEKPVVVLTFGHANELPEGGDPLKDVSLAQALATKLGRDVFVPPGDASWEQTSRAGRLTLRQSGGGEGEGLDRVVPERQGEALALVAQWAGVSDEVTAGQVERLLQFLFRDTLEARRDYWSLVSAAGALFRMRQAAGLPVADGSGRLSWKEVSDFASVRGLLDAVAPHIRGAFVTLLGKILDSPLRAESPAAVGFPDAMAGSGGLPVRGDDSLDVMDGVEESSVLADFSETLGALGESLDVMGGSRDSSPLLADFRGT